MLVPPPPGARRVILSPSSKPALCLRTFLLLTFFDETMLRNSLTFHLVMVLPLDEMAQKQSSDVDRQPAALSDSDLFHFRRVS